MLEKFDTMRQDYVWFRAEGLPEGAEGVLESVLHVDELGFSLADGYSDHIEAECCVVGLPNGEVVSGEGA